MTVHLVKLCVGVDSADYLQRSIRRRLIPNPVKTDEECFVHVTRMTPKRRDEILDGGSLYWVINGTITVRSPIVALEPVDEGDGIKRCGIFMAPDLVKVEPRSRRPFQGWRYLKTDDAPRDLPGSVIGDGQDDLPSDMLKDLGKLGLI